MTATLDSTALTLVTGATGLIGRALVQRLVSAGQRVRVLVRRPVDLLGVEGVEAVVGDVCDAAGRARALPGVAVVHHLATLKDHLAGEADLERVNVQATVDLFREAAAAGVSRFVHASSVSAEPGGGSTAYGRSKIRAEAALQHAAQALQAAGVAAPVLIVLRPGPVYCEDRPRLRQAARWARRWRVLAHLVPDTVVHLASRDNVVQAFERAATQGRPGAAYAICDAEPLPRSALTALLAAETGAWDLPLPAALFQAGGRAAVRAEAAWAAWHHRPPRLDAHLLHMLLRERRYAIDAACRDLGYEPESTERGFTRAVRRCLADAARPGLPAAPVP
jgi:nucleoside-diphosphate-sugar epimerase